MGRGNYIPPVSCYSSADYDCIYVDDELVYGEEHWEKCSQADYYYLYEDFKETLIDSFLRRFPSFVRNDAEWLDNQTKIVAENELCMLTVCDYDTYLAVSVIAKEDDYNEAIDTPSIKDFKIVKKIPASQLMDDYYFDDTVPLEKRNRDFLSLFEEEDYVDEFRTFTLKDFLKLEPNGSPEIQRILDWKVTMDPYLLEHGITVEQKKTIYINTADYVNYIDTFIHEVNHVIQYEYRFTRGFNPQIAYRMPQFLDYILQNYTELVAYQLRRSDFVEDANLLLEEKSSGKIDWSKERNVNRRDLERICAYIGYRLVQGELWAESYMHNGKLIRSFTMAQAESGRTYLISPDGKHKFLIPVKATENLKLPTRKIKPNKMLIENAMVRQFKKILESSNFI